MDDPQVEIPQYRCHKIVRAAKITAFRQNRNPQMHDIVLGEIGGIVTQLFEWHQKHKPQVGGYYVVYDDGYTSFSPAKAFEDGYAAFSQQPDKYAAHAPHQRRVLIEKDELDEKLSKLNAFFATPIFTGLNEEARQLLVAQSRVMDDYSSILRARIAAF